MTIDFHTHIFPEKIADRTIAFLSAKSGVKNNTDGTADGLVKSMDAANVDISVVMPVATKPSQFDSITKYACLVNEKYAGRLVSFGGIHPYSENYKRELRIIKENGLKGIKLHPDYQDFFIDDIRAKRLIYEASALGLIITVHAGTDIGYGDPVHCPPQKSLEVIKEVQPEKLVLAHMGGWEQWDEVEELLCGQDIWLDTAFCLEYMSKERMRELTKKHGYERVLFATDSPWSPQDKYLKTMREFFTDEAEFNAITGENAKQLLGSIDGR